MSTRRTCIALAATALSMVTAIGIADTGWASVRTEATSPFGTALTIDGHGTFHAIGLGQWGALGYAVDDGWSSAKILDHYYGGTVAATEEESNVTVLLSALNGAQTAVVHDEGGAVLVGDATERSFSALVAREVAPNSYDVWGRTTGAICPSASTELTRAGGWRRIATGVGPTVTFRSVTDAPANDALGRLLGVCEPGSTVRYYRGRIKALNTSDGSNRTINVVPMESMLRSVVAWEMSPSWADLGNGKGAQALQAQAVAARSYILSYAWYPHARTCDNICVAYRGAASRAGGPSGSRTNHEDARATAAVDATAGLVRRRGSATGPIALTMYSASTGGWTAPASGLASFTPVEDAGDDYRAGLSGGNPWHDWTRTVPVATVEATWPAIGVLHSISVQRNGYGDWGGRVSSVTLVGSKGSVTISGDTFPRTLGLPSNWFRVRGAGGTTTTTTPPTTAPPVVDCGSRTPPVPDERLAVSAASRLTRSRGTVLADTRDSTVLGAGCTLRVATGAPVGTTAVVLNVTAVDPSRGGLVTVYACGTRKPSMPTFTSVAGRSVSASSIVALGRRRSVCVHSTSTTDVVVESYGRFSPEGAARFTPVAPFRRVDTRSGLAVGANRPLTVRIAGRDGIPSGAGAVAVTVHALQSSGSGDVSIYPCAAGPSAAVILSVRSGETVANGATAALDRNGTLCLRSTTSVHLMVDVTGWYGRRGRSAYYAIPATRIGDTRSGTLGTAFSALEDRSVRLAGRGPIPSSGVVAVAGTLTVADVTTESYITVHSCAGAAPSLSMVRNVPPSGTASSSTVVGLASGRWCLRPGAAMNVRLDALGWFA